MRFLHFRKSRGRYDSGLGRVDRSVIYELSYTRNYVIYEQFLLSNLA